MRRGQASKCLYFEELRGISASVHGDDVSVKASREDAEWLIRKFKERYEIKTQMIGEAADLDKQLQISTERCDGVLEGFGQKQTRGMCTDPELGHEETTMFRSVAARLNDLSQDRPDITFATMKLCSKMSRPYAQDLKNMKRLGRFLVGRPRVGFLFEWQAHPSALHALTKQQSIVATSTAEAELYAGKFRRLPKTWAESFRFGCTLTPVQHCP